ncbi:hypothetical protein L1887_54231 [Cichorium endivia]|nr:hypothetical protein L1887_54231 [Cichorium endivia]
MLPTWHCFRRHTQPHTCSWFMIAAQHVRARFDGLTVPLRVSLSLARSDAPTPPIPPASVAWHCIVASTAARTRIHRSNRRLKTLCIDHPCMLTNTAHKWPLTLHCRGSKLVASFPFTPPSSSRMHCIFAIAAGIASHCIAMLQMSPNDTPPLGSIHGENERE